MRKLTPFETRSLIATENALCLKQSENQFVRIPATNMNWVNDYDLGISFCFCLNSITSNNNFLFERRLLHSDSVDGYYCFIQPIDSNRGYLKFGIYEGIIESLDSLIIEVGRMYRVTVNISDNIYIKLNDGKTFVQPRSSHVLDPGLLNHLSIGVDDDFSNGHDKTADCLISNLVFIKGTFSESEITFLHDNNVLPESVHPKVIAHYPLNQNYGGKAYDVVEQYNYTKVTPLIAVHGELINYSSDELGDVNVLTQTAWRNFYLKKKIGNVFLRMNIVTGGYMTIPSFTGQTIPVWTMMFYVIAPTITGTPQAVFGNYTAAPTLYMRFNTTAFQLEIFFGAGASNRLGAIPYEPGETIKFLIQTDGVNSNIYDQSGAPSVFPQAFTNDDFANFILGYNHFFGNTFDGGFGRIVMLNKICNQRERNLLYSLDKSQEYKSISNILFDLDFGSLIESGGNYYAQDESGNNRNAQLLNFALSDKPVRLERQTGLPERIKALRFAAANNHYLSIGNFNPTSEKGYTHIVGYKKISNVPSSFDVLIGKRGAEFKALVFNPSTTEIKYWGSYNGGPAIDPKTNDSINFVHCIETSQFYELGINGYYISKGIQSGMIGYDFDNNDFNIGYDNGNYLDGYLFLIGIWKGVLTQKDILNIIDNGLYGNATPNLMTDCQLYINFDEIKTVNPIFDKENVQPGDFVLYENGANPSINYGSDSDGNYVEFTPDLSSGSNYIYVTNEGLPMTLGKEYLYTLKIKRIGGTGNFVFLHYGTNAGGTPVDLASSPLNTLITIPTTFICDNISCQPTFLLGFSTGSTIGDMFRIYFMKVEEVSKYRIKDWSPQNHDVMLHNYTLAEVTPGDPSYRLVDVDSLR